MSNNKEIDVYDLDRMADKIQLLKKVIEWLVKLKKLDPTINKNEIDKVLSTIRTKKCNLEKKYAKGYAIIGEEADFLAKNCTEEY